MTGAMIGAEGREAGRGEDVAPLTGTVLVARELHRGKMQAACVAAVLLLACLAGSADARQLLQDNSQCSSCVGGHPGPGVLHRLGS